MDEFEALYKKEKDVNGKKTEGVDDVAGALETIEKNVTDQTQKDAFKKMREGAKNGKDKCKSSLDKISAGRLCYLISG